MLHGITGRSAAAQESRRGNRPPRPDQGVAQTPIQGKDQPGQVDKPPTQGTPPAPPAGIGDAQRGEKLTGKRERRTGGRRSQMPPTPPTATHATGNAPGQRAADLRSSIMGRVRPGVGQAMPGMPGTRPSAGRPSLAESLTDAIRQQVMGRVRPGNAPAQGSPAQAPASNGNPAPATPQAMPPAKAPTQAPAQAPVQTPGKPPVKAPAAVPDPPAGKPSPGQEAPPAAPNANPAQKDMPFNQVYSGNKGRMAPPTGTHSGTGKAYGDEPVQSPKSTDDYRNNTTWAAREMGVDPGVLRAIARRESDWVPQAVGRGVNADGSHDVNGPGGSNGIFQFVPGTFEGFKERAFKDNPRAWKKIGVTDVSQISYTNDTHQALVAASMIKHGDGRHWVTYDEAAANPE